MKRFSHWLIMTDLDGTLLDHHSYSAAPAGEALSILAKLNIPCIFNTSKTFTETVQLRRQLNNLSPFSCENGSALFVAKKTQKTAAEATLTPAESADISADYNTEILGSRYSDLLKVLHQARMAGFKFRSFNDMPVNEVTAITGLSEQDAYMAKQRLASEPLLWQDQEQRLTEFRQLIEKNHCQLIKGGRFYHLMGNTDKSSAINFFRNYYSECYQTSPHEIGVVALGDGENDRKMLEASDYPIVIPAANNAPLSITHPHAITADHPGPAGWNQAIKAFIQTHLNV